MRYLVHDDVVTGFASFLRSLSKRKHRTVGAAAHPPPGTTQN